MRVTTKGQVTIPQEIREKLGITPAVEVDFIEEKDRIYFRSATLHSVSLPPVVECLTKGGQFSVVITNLLIKKYFDT